MENLAELFIQLGQEGAITVHQLPPPPRFLIVGDGRLVGINPGRAVPRSLQPAGGFGVLCRLSIVIGDDLDVLVRGIERGDGAGGVSMELLPPLLNQRVIGDLAHADVLEDVLEIAPPPGKGDLRLLQGG